MMERDGICSRKLQTLKYLLFIPLILLSACTAFVAKPEVTVKDVKLAGVSSDGVNLDIHLSVYNNNSYDLKMKGYNYDVKILALPMAKGTSAEPCYFYAKTLTDALIPVKISYDDLLEVLKRHPNPDAIPYQLHADLAVETSLGDITIPVNKSGTVALPKEYQPSNIFKKISNFLRDLE